MRNAGLDFERHSRIRRITELGSDVRISQLPPFILTGFRFLTESTRVLI